METVDSRQLKIYGSIRATPVDWLWFPYIPFGKVTLIQGDPGCGKSTLIINIISAVSSGTKLPDGSMLKKPLHVIYQCSEDGIGDTIKPRLIAAGADCNNVAFIDEESNPLTINEDSIRRAIADFNAKLVVIDPIQAYMGDTDMSSALAMRKVLRKLSNWATLYDCAIILIGHLNKSQGSKDLYRSLGSIDLVATARSVMEVDLNNEMPGLRCVRHIKSSLAERGDDRFFTIDKEGRLAWKNSDDYSKTSCCLPSFLDKKRKQDQAAELLYYLLADGPMRASDIQNYFCERSISEKTVNIVKKMLGIQSVKKDGVWYWQLSEIK